MGQGRLCDFALPSVEREEAEGEKKYNLGQHH